MPILCQAILTKVGYLLSVVSIFVVAFIAFRILGFDIGSLILTWVRACVELGDGRCQNGLLRRRCSSPSTRNCSSVNT